MVAGTASDEHVPVERATHSPEPGPPAPAGVEQTSRLGGHPLDPSTRSFMEARFATDFSGVRLHDGGRAAELAKQVGARAFTVGEHLFFDRGEFRPGVPDGLKLVAHELAHVVQQRQTGPVLLRKPRPGWIPPTRRQLREDRPTEDELVRAMHPANRSKQKGNTSLLQVAHEVTPNLLWQNQNPPQLPPGQTIPPNAVAWVLAKIVSTTENDAKGAQRPHIRAHLENAGTIPPASKDAIATRAGHEDDHWTLARMVAVVADRELQGRLDAGEQIGQADIDELVARAELFRDEITKRFDERTADGESSIPALIWGIHRVQWNRVVRGWKRHNK